MPDQAESRCSNTASAHASVGASYSTRINGHEREALREDVAPAAHRSGQHPPVDAIEIRRQQLDTLFRRNPADASA
jgi:hypothetical protein